MCSNFEPVKTQDAGWVKQHFECALPTATWRDETFPTYPAPFIYLDNGTPRCELAQFGLVPEWAQDKKKFGLKTYNARSETVHEKPSYRRAWRERRFGLVLTRRFYEPCYETGRAIRTSIYRRDGEPAAIASIWERIVDKESGEVLMSFSMLTVNADDHPLMKRFHKPDDEKRSVVVIQSHEFKKWLTANHEDAFRLLKAPEEQDFTADFQSDSNQLF